MHTHSHNQTDNGITDSQTTSTDSLAKARLPRGTTHYLHDGKPPVSFLTVRDVRTRWQISGMQIWRLRNKGTLIAYKIGERGVRFLLSDIERIEREAMTVKKGDI